MTSPSNRPPFSPGLEVVGLSGATSLTASTPRDGEFSRLPNQVDRLLEYGSDDMLSEKTPMRLFLCSLGTGGSGGLMHGESLYSSQVLTSKKSTSYLSSVLLSMKHLP